MSRAQYEAKYRRDLPPTLREDRGRELSQAEIAERLGVSKTRVQKLERIALAKMRAAAEAEGINLEALFL